MNTNKLRFPKLSLWLVFILLLSFPAFAQNAKPKVELAKRAEDFTLDSKLMARQMPYRVILPVNYKNSNEKTSYPVVYLLHGLTGHFDNWSERTKIAEYSEKYNYIIVMPEGENGWYTDSATIANDRYESYIVQELIPEIDKKFRTAADRKHRIIGGLSMGGYGSIKFGLKYAEMFSLVGSFSGALGAAGWTESAFAKMNVRGAIADSIKSVYGADDSKTRMENDIFRVVREMSPEKIKTLPFIYQSCGTEDFLIQSNQEFARLLFERKIPHEFRQLPGGHTWAFWDEQVKEFLEVSEKFIKY